MHNSRLIIPMPYFPSVFFVIGKYACNVKAEAEMLKCAMRYYGKTSKVPDEAQIKIDQLSKNVSINIYF